jgi:LCP family protein required for cell wall assembly
MTQIKPYNAPLVTAFLSVVVLAGFMTWSWYCAWWQSPPPRTAGSGMNPAFSQFGLPSRPYTVLFLGDDVSYTWDGERQIADPASFNGRSDTMLLLRIDPAAMSVTALQIPRDTIADIPGYGQQKINAATALGGPLLAKAAVSELVGMPVDHYFLLNLQGLVDGVNELGGITVEVPKRMAYMDWTAKLKIDLEPGAHTLNGNQAMGFVRFRHDDLGDIGRIQRQQIFMRALSQKLLNPTSWSHVPRLLDIVHRNVVTDLSDADQMQAFNLLRSMPGDQLRFVMLPGRFGDSGNWVPDQQALEQVVSAWAGFPSGASDRRNVTIAIKNISSFPGLDRRLGAMLKRTGYSVVVLSNRRQNISTRHRRTKIIAQLGNVGDAQLVQRDLGCGDIVNASIGDIYNSITVLADDDLKPLIDRLSSEQSTE